MTLLLTGDAEVESWAVIRSNGVDFRSSMLKIGHHGSIDASPAWGFERVFPSRRNTNALVLSTNPLIFPTGNEVPKKEVVESWTDAIARRSPVELVFDR